MPTPTPTGEGERLLQALQQRLARATPPRDALAAAIGRAGRKEARRQAAAAPAPAAPEESPPPPPPEPSTAGTHEQEGTAGAAADGAADERDPREQEDWFQRLPTAEQDRLRRRWQHERHRFDFRPAELRFQAGRAFWHGVAVSFGAGLLAGFVVGFGCVLPLTAAGGIAAVLAQSCGGGRFLYAVGGFLAFLAVVGPGALLDNPFGLCGLVLFTGAHGALGVDREMRRSGGFGPRG